ncbi:MAG: glycoside hydrolase family 32 protein [Flavisolibacter sp.]
MRSKSDAMFTLKYPATLLFFLLTYVSSFSQNVGAATEVKTRDIEIKKGQMFLNLPVNPSVPQFTRARIRSGEKLITQFNIRLSENPTFWTFFDVSPFQGKTITVEIENAPQFNRGPQASVTNAAPPALNVKALQMIFPDKTYPGRDSVYKEKDRPQIHFSSQRGHLNDPNGLIFYKSEYHLFYQHNPYGIDGGNQHWGHAVSKDLLHWIQLPEAIYPTMGFEDVNGRGDLAFSGSATYDPENTGGFRKNGIDPLIAFYTSTGRGECIKLSYDNGRTFVDYEGNPIIKHSGRDPKIFWYAPGDHWVLVLYDNGQPKKMSLGQVASIRENSIYTSADMRHWTYQSGVPGFFECPDFYELPVEGEGISKWVMSDASGRYLLGSFDGKNFHVDQQLRDYIYGGRYYYAAQTFNNMPDSRRVQIGWGLFNYPDAPFTQAMLFPTELKLKRAYDGIRLCPTPVKEIASLYTSNHVVENKVVTSDSNSYVSISVNPDVPLHLVAEFEKGDAPVSINIEGYELRYDNEWQFFAIPPMVPGSQPAPANPFAMPANAMTIKYVKANTDIFKIEAILDKNILEVYVNDGEVYYVTEFKGQKNGKIQATVAPVRSFGSVQPVTRKFIVKKLEVHELDSIWPKSMTYSAWTGGKIK